MRPFLLRTRTLFNWHIIIVFICFINRFSFATFPLFRSIWYQSTTTTTTTTTSTTTTEPTLAPPPYLYQNGTVGDVEEYRHQATNLDSFVHQPNSFMHYQLNQTLLSNHSVLSTTNKTISNVRIGALIPLEEIGSESNEIIVPVENNTIQDTEHDNVEMSDEKPFEVLIKNDKTMARIKFDLSGHEVVECTLYDLEQDIEAPDVVPTLTGLKPPLEADFATINEAVRRCTKLAKIKYGLKESFGENGTVHNDVSLNVTTEASIDTSTNSSISSNNNTINESSIAGSLIGNKPSMPAFDPNNFFAFWRGIVPGTKWCGLGDMAHQYEDIGTKIEADICCRAHDHCPLRIKAFRKGYGYFNFAFSTRSHCDCDHDFYKCLKESNNSFAYTIGNFYFNILKVHCLKEEQTVVCVKKRDTPPEGCAEYEVSKNFKVKLYPFEKPF